MENDLEDILSRCSHLQYVVACNGKMGRKTTDGLFAISGDLGSNVEHPFEPLHPIIYHFFGGVCFSSYCCCFDPENMQTKRLC